MLLSILIPTMASRVETRKELLSHINSQVTPDVEVVLHEDSGQISIGEKRNILMGKAKGQFTVFVDDDDWVSDTYVRDILWAIARQPGLDCVGFFGEVIFAGNYGGIMVHSSMCCSWTEEPECYYRPPNHLNPVRRKLAMQVAFKPIRMSEDHFWSTEMKAKGLLKREVFLSQKPLYFYRCRDERRGL